MGKLQGYIKAIRKGLHEHRCPSVYLDIENFSFRQVLGMCCTKNRRNHLQWNSIEATLPLNAQPLNRHEACSGRRKGALGKSCLHQNILMCRKLNKTCRLNLKHDRAM